MPRDVNPVTLTFRELHRWGWISQGHCGACRMSLKGDVAGMAALSTGDRPIALRFARGLYACCVCKTPLTGITIMGKVRRDGMRRLVELGQCPDPSCSSDAASDDPFASRMWPSTTGADDPAWKPVASPRGVGDHLAPFDSGDPPPMTVTLHGIKACDTMKKARDWLDGHGVAYGFHDYKAVGIDAATLRGWAGKVGWDVLLNKAGTTFRNLPDADKTGIDEGKAIALMVAQPSMIKRPVLDIDGALLVGFKPEQYAAAFA